VTGYIIRRIINMIIVLIGISIISFVIIQLPPGDFLTTYILHLQSAGTAVDESLIESLKKYYGLDQPLYIQYLKWIKNIVFHGEWGRSFEWNKAVSTLIMERLPMTLVVSISSLIITYVIALPIAIYSATHRYSVVDYIATTIGFIGLSVPGFLIALILMFVFYNAFGISVGGLFSREMVDAPWSFAKFVDLLNHLWVPVIVLSIGGTAGIIRTLRAMLLDELNKDYVKVALSKGFPKWRAILKYPVRIAIIPIVSTIGWTLPDIFSGATIISVVLNLPTTGPLLLQALISQDMFLAGSFVLIMAILTVIGTFISDILLMWVDPRVRYE